MTYFNQLSLFVFGSGAWIPTMKVAMNHFGPVKVGLARPALTNLNPDQASELVQDLSELIAF